MSLCKYGHLKDKSGIIGLNRCKICRYKRQYESRKHLLFERSFIINVIKSVPCSDCRWQYDSCAMQFDHVSGKKYKAISQMTERNSLKKIFSEIAKCEIVCSNCHAKRTQNRAKMR